MTISRLAVAACIAMLPTVALADEAKKGMDMKGMDMKGTDVGASPADAAYMKAMQAMHEDMAGAKPSGDADKDFVGMMLPHHQGAVDMAKVELQYGKDKQLRKLAADIVKAQEKEIAFMKEWQAKHAK